MLPGGRVVTFQPRGKIFGEGDPSDRIAIIINGVVKITAASASGKQALLGLRGSGEIVGELGAIYGSPRSASVLALNTVQARMIPASTFQRCLLDNPDAMLAVLGAVIGRLRESDRRRLEFTSADVLERVGILLAELARTHGETASDGTVTIGLPLSQEEIAGATGASREAVAKALRRLRAIGAVATARQRIVVLDRQALYTRSL